MTKITALDQFILRKLLKDGRASYTQIAKAYKTSTESVHYRVKRLIKEKIILGFNTKFNYKALGYREQTLFLTLNKISEDIEEEATKILVEYPFTLWAGTCVNEYDFKVIIVSKDAEQQEKIINDIYSKLRNNIKHIEVIERIQKTRSKQYSNTPYFGKNAAEEQAEKESKNKRSKEKKLDQTDWKIMKALALDARASYKDIGQEIGLSGEDIAYRLKKLQEAHIIEGFSVSIDYAASGKLWCILLLDIKNKEKKEEIMAFLHDKPQTTTVIENVGKWVCDVTFFSENIEDINEYTKKFRESFSEDINEMKLIFHKDSLKHPKCALGIFE